MGTFKYDQCSRLLCDIGGEFDHGVGEHILLCCKNFAEIFGDFGCIDFGLSDTMRTGSIAASFFYGSGCNWFQRKDKKYMAFINGNHGFWLACLAVMLQSLTIMEWSDDELRF